MRQHLAQWKDFASIRAELALLHELEMAHVFRQQYVLASSTLPLPPSLSLSLPLSPTPRAYTRIHTHTVSLFR